MACPMRIVLVFLSAVVAAVLAWRTWNHTNEKMFRDSQKTSSSSLNGNRGVAAEEPTRKGHAVRRDREPCEKRAVERASESSACEEVAGRRNWSEGKASVVSCGRPSVCYDVRLAGVWKDAIYTLLDFWTGAYLWQMFKESFLLDGNVPSAPGVSATVTRIDSGVIPAGRVGSDA